MQPPESRDPSPVELEATLDCLGHQVRRSSRALTAFFNARMRSSGIRVTQTPILFALRLSGALSLAELAAAVGLDHTTLSRNLKPLVRDDLVDLTSGVDRRRRFARLTASGIKKCGEIYPLWRDAHAELTRRLPGLKSELRTLERLEHIAIDCLSVASEKTSHVIGDRRRDRSELIFSRGRFSTEHPFDEKDGHSVDR